MRLTISRGDQRRRNFPRTYFRNLSSPASLFFPRLRDDAAARDRVPAENARYPLLPLFRFTSRDMVLTALPNHSAMCEIVAPRARPRLISSRSIDEIRRYCFVVCIRIYYSHIRCVKCVTPSMKKSLANMITKRDYCLQIEKIFLL